MLLFENPKSYSEMTKKISYTVLWVSTIGLFIVSQISADLADLMKTISVGLTIEQYGIQFSISYVYIPLVISTLENMFHLHDKISSLFGIRYRYDKKIIIGHFLKTLNMYVFLQSVNKKNREAIMNKVFYQYASSTKPQIDEHLIHQALGSWAWYWILLDTLAIVIITGLLLLLHEFTVSTLLIYLLVIVIICFLMIAIKNFDCRKHSIAEVDAILAYRPWKRKIVGIFENALSNK